MTKPDDRPTFVCVDCGYDVYVFGVCPPGLTRCTTCQWIADLPDADDRERVRAFLKERADD
jgi:hypothetical protein